MNDKLEIIKYYIYYKTRNKLNKKYIEKNQQKMIKKHLKFVTQNSEFYKKYKNKPLSQFPIIDKKIMMENFNAINTVKIDKNEALDFAINGEKERNFVPKLNNITIGLSSGTSNTRGVFMISDKEKNKWAGYILANVIPNPITEKHKIAFFMRANSNLYESISSKRITFKFFDIFEPMDKNIKRLIQLDADILVGQPSVLIEICKYLEKNKVIISPKKVISIAEVLEEQDEKYIKNVLKQKVIHQVYQCTEGCLATTCKYGTIHLNEDAVYIEKEYIDEKRFIPIITDFSRTSQPIIRYRLNDILVEKKDKCKCGNICTPLERIEGREDDLFIFKTNTNSTIKVFPDCIRRCVLFSGNVEEYKVVQLKDGNINIYIDETNDIKNKIIQEFEKLSAEMNFILPNIEFLDYEYNKKKKLKRIESLIH